MNWCRGAIYIATNKPGKWNDLYPVHNANSLLLIMYLVGMSGYIQGQCSWFSKEVEVNMMIRVVLFIPENKFWEFQKFKCKLK